MVTVVKNRKHEFWKEHIEKWQASGLSQPAYCEGHQLKLSTFVYYRHRLFNSNQGQSEGVNFVSVSSPPGLKSFQPISDLQLKLPNGIRIGVSSTVSETLLQMVLKVAGQVPC